jgi:serine/threonine-protein kinase RsbW
MAPSDQDEQPVRAQPVALPGAGEEASAAALSFVLAPTWASASIARERVEDWLGSLRWPSGQADDLVLAVSEAVSNGVEHGYRVAVDEVDVRGRIEVDARMTAGPTTHTRQVEFTVRDGGRWREHGSDDDGRHRGHGVPIMRSCTSTMSITTDPEGTTVAMVSNPVPSLSRST